MKKLLGILLLIGLLSACQTSVNTDGASVSVGANGVNVTTSGAQVSVSASGVSVSASGINLAQIALGTTELSDEDKSQYAELMTEEFEVTNCGEQFNQLVKTFGNNYEACFADRKPITQCTSEKKVGKVNVAIVFDDSGSMAAKIGNERMIDIAKDELKNYISTLDSSIGGAVFVYGHKGSNQSGGKSASCSAIESFGEFSNKSEIISKISALEPTGWTPIDASLQEAEKYLNSISGADDQKVIVLISDGKETCGGNPVATAKNIASKPNTFIDVIGFNVSGDTQKELQQIALNGGGKYSDVRSRLDFQNVFADMKAFSQEISCGASQAAIQLRDAADSLNTYYSCMYNLREEQVKIMTHVTMACESEVASSMNNRIQ